MLTPIQSRKIRVGVMRGGPSGEYNMSLKTGKNVIDALRNKQEKYEVQDIFIDRNGAWHIAGLIRPFERIFPHIDVAVNALHGAYGEDGRVQKLLESHNIPFTGSGSLSSAIGLNKPLAKKYFKMHGLLTPEHFVIKKENYSPQLLKKISIDYPHLRLVKPATSGSSLGVTVVNKIAKHVAINSQELEKLESAVAQAFEHADSVMLEEYIRGREATCGIVEGSSASNGQAFALHPVEIRDAALFCPGDFTDEEIARIQQAALDAHKALGLRHYSSSDFILNRMGIYILEVNSLPTLTSVSRFPKALSAADISLSDFLDHIITLAVEKHN